jgi:hypothetical protein
MTIRFLFSNTAYNLIFQIVTAVIGISVTTFLFKHVETQQFLSFSYLAIALFILNYTNFGVPLITTRSLSRTIKKSNQIDQRQIQVSFFASFFICLTLILIVKVFETYVEISVFDNKRFFTPLYGLIIFYFIHVHIRSVSDGVGSFGVSRFVKSYFYIFFFISAFLTGYYELSAVYNFFLLILFASLLVPRLLYQISFSIGENFIKEVLELFRKGLPFLQLAVVSALIGYLDRFLIGFYVSGVVLASILYILDIASRQGLIGTAMSNVLLQFFIVSEKSRSEFVLRIALFLIMIHTVVSVAAIYFEGDAILNLLDLGVYKIPVLNAWVGYSLLVFGAIQWQWIIALSLEKSWTSFLMVELLILPFLLYFFLKIDAVFYISVIIYLRACVQILVADILLERSFINILLSQLFFLLILVVINTTFI